MKTNLIFNLPELKILNKKIVISQIQKKNENQTKCKQEKNNVTHISRLKSPYTKNICKTIKMPLQKPKITTEEKLRSEVVYKKNFCLS